MTLETSANNLDTEGGLTWNQELDFQELVFSPEKLINKAKLGDQTGGRFYKQGFVQLFTLGALRMTDVCAD